MDDRNDVIALDVETGPMRSNNNEPLEIVVISGKGGTGKTSLTAAFAMLAENCVVADCDVDAANLHLILEPEVLEKHEFWSGNYAVIRDDDCTQCGTCAEYCRFDAVIRVESGGFWIDETACEGCGVCVHFCPEDAIDFPQRLCGEWMVSRTRAGVMVHARLGIAAENSGKLVATVRNKAKEIASRDNIPLILIDGPPGIGCPVISSITGTHLVLVVVEPTVSGLHDMERVLALARHFKIPAAVCLNKWDLNPDAARAIEAKANDEDVPVIGKIPYDPVFTRLQIEKKSIVEEESHLKEVVCQIWSELIALGGKHGVS